MPSSRMKIRRLMFVVAVIAVLLGCGVQAWRWYQREKFAREYALGWLEIEGDALVGPGHVKAGGVGDRHESRE
jgi:hypothetical protein